MKSRARTTYVAVIALVTAAGSSAIAACSSSSSSDDGIGATDSGPTDSTTTDTGPVVDDDAGSDASREPSTKLAAGGYTTCALTPAALKCWGINNYGDVGVPADGVVHSPTLVPGLTFAPAAIAGGNYATCATDGTHTSCWGYNSSLQLAPVDGTSCVSSFCTPVTVPAGPILKMAVGGESTCFLGTSGTVSCRGYDGSGQLGTASDGGGGAQGLVTIAGLTDIVDIGAGYAFFCALSKTGAVSCWGEDDYGEIGQAIDAGDGVAPVSNGPNPVPLQIPGLVAKQMSIAPYGGCAVTTTGTVTCWGYNGYDESIAGGQLGHDPVTDPICNFYHCDPTATTVAGIADVREVSSGYYNTCAIKNDDTVMCWGIEEYGELGSAPELDAGSPGFSYNFTPQPIPGLTNIAHVSMGYDHACAVSWTGVVSCWGDNSNGQLGVPNADGGPTFSRTLVTPVGF